MTQIIRDDLEVKGYLQIAGDLEFSGSLTGEITSANLGDEFDVEEVVSGTVLDWSKSGGTKTLTAETTFTFSNLRVGTYNLRTIGDFSIILPSGFTYSGGERSASGETLYKIECMVVGTPVGYYIILKDES